MPPREPEFEAAFPLGNGPPLRVAVCGGREFLDRKLVHLALDRANARRAIRTLVHSGAAGAQTLAGEWAAAHGLEVEVVKPEALFELLADAYIVFQAGALDCAARARAAGVPSWEPYRWREPVVVPRARRPRRG